ncbi:TauD/TfdA family dioxygenase [Acinetobacter oleivorans]|uniref:TauD/TfdA family dioxygenase n=1 Tax=Acinetobacter oleivorans TaxID=1148157 RepID=UPI003A8835F4
MFSVKDLSPFGALITASGDHDNINEIGAEVLNNLLSQYKVLVFRGFKALPDPQYINFCESLGNLMYWEFGALLNVKMEQDPKNHIFSKGRVELHWDGAFAKQTPRINAFQCTVSSEDGRGGETLFVDTTRILKDIPSSQLEDWKKIKLSYSTEKKAHYGGSIDVNLIENHPHKGHSVIRFIEIENEDNQEVNPVQLSIKDKNHQPVESQEIVQSITEILYDPKYMYQHQWVSGDYMLIDNNSVLHGRAKVEGNVNRHLKRVHIL